MISESKIRLRKNMQLLRSKIPSNERIIYERSIVNNFMKYVPNLKLKTISGFKAINGEPNLDSLYSELAADNIICFPCIVDKNIIFKKQEEGGKFVINPIYQILEPESGSLEIIPDILLLPLLAADKQGNRLGFGGGFYDRYLQYASEVKKIITIGICFDGQIVEEVPVENHDQKLDFILSDKRFIR